MKFKQTLLFILEKNKIDNIEEMRKRHLNNCVWLLATDKRSKNLKSFEEMLNMANGKVKIDNRTSQEIIEDTKELFKGAKFELKGN